MKITRLGFYSTSDVGAGEFNAVSGSITESWFHKEIKTGSISEVAHAISEKTQPDDLIFFATNSTGNALLTELDSLSEVCDPNSVVYIFSPERDVFVYRKILSLGVAGCEALPVDQEFILSEIRNYLSLESKGQLILGGPILPGVGFSTAFLNVASRCAYRLGEGQSASFIDSDYSSGITNLFVVDKPRSYVQFDGRSGPDVFAGAVIPESSKWNNLHVFPSPARLLERRDVAANFIEDGLPNILKKCDYTFIDFGSFAQLWGFSAIDYSDRIFLASRPSLNGIRLLREIVQNILDTRGAIEKIVCVLIGHGRSHKNELDEKKIRELLPSISIFYIPDMPSYVFANESSGSLAFQSKRARNKYEKSIDAICKSIIS